MNLKEYEFTYYGPDEDWEQGTPIYPFLFQPNWENGVEIVNSFETVIANSPSFYEQRRPINANMLKELSGDFLLTNTDKQKFINDVQFLLNKVVLCPVFTEKVTPTSTLTGETTFTHNDLTDFFYISGCQFLLIADYENEIYEICQYTWTDDDIELLYEVETVFDIEKTVIYPCFFSKIGKWDIDNENDNVVNASLTFWEVVLEDNPQLWCHGNKGILYQTWNPWGATYHRIVIDEYPYVCVPQSLPGVLPGEVIYSACGTRRDTKNFLMLTKPSGATRKYVKFYDALTETISENREGLPVSFLNIGDNLGYTVVFPDYLRPNRYALFFYRYATPKVSVQEWYFNGNEWALNIASSADVGGWDKIFISYETRGHWALTYSLFPASGFNCWVNGQLINFSGLSGKTLVPVLHSFATLQVTRQVVAYNKKVYVTIPYSYVGTDVHIHHGEFFVEISGENWTVLDQDEVIPGVPNPTYRWGLTTWGITFNRRIGKFFFLRVTYGPGGNANSFTIYENDFSTPFLSLNNCNSFLFSGDKYIFTIQYGVDSGNYPAVIDLDTKEVYFSDKNGNAPKSPEIDGLMRYYYDWNEIP